MKLNLEKFVSLERDVFSEKGRFLLFALFLREDAPDKWDLVVSAPWVKAGKKAALDYFAQQLQSRLKPSELLSLSRIVLIDESHPALEAIHKAVTVEHGTVEMRNRDFFGFPIEQAYIITSSPKGVS